MQRFLLFLLIVLGLIGHTYSDFSMEKKELKDRLSVTYSTEFSRLGHFIPSDVRLNSDASTALSLTGLEENLLPLINFAPSRVSQLASLNPKSYAFVFVPTVLYRPKAFVRYFRRLNLPPPILG